jgi:hypothetical protein
MENMTDEEKKEEAKRRAIILMTLKEGYNPQKRINAIKNLSLIFMMLNQKEYLLILIN